MFGRHLVRKGVLAVNGSSDDVVPAPPRGANATLTAIDQILSSASNALMILALAQVASVGQFGIAALMITIIMTCVGFNRGATGTALLLLSNATFKQIRAEAGYATSWSVATLVVASCVVLASSAALGEFWLGVAFALVAPIIAMQDTLRLTALAMGNALAAVISDGLWTVWVGALFVVNSLDLWGSPEGSVYVYGLGGAVAWLVLVFATRATPSIWRIWQWWCTYWRSRLRFGVNYSLDQLGAVLMTAIATVVVGTAAAAAIRGAATLFGPLAMLITAFMLIFVPEARRSTEPVRAQWRRMLKGSGFLSLLGIGTVVVLVSIPDSIGELILGDVWQPAMSVVPYLGISCVAIAWIVSINSMLAVLGMSRMLLSVHLIQVVLIAIFTAIGGLVLSTAVGIAIGEAAAAWVYVMIAFTVVSRVVKRVSSDAAAQPSHGESKATSAKVLT